MLKKNMDIKLILEITKLSKEELESLQQTRLIKILEYFAILFSYLLAISMYISK